MSKRKGYKASHVVDLDRADFIFIGIDDSSSSSSIRSQEVLQMATKMYRLAFKTGKVSKLEREEFNESA